MSRLSLHLLSLTKIEFHFLIQVQVILNKAGDPHHHPKALVSEVSASPSLPLITLDPALEVSVGRTLALADSPRRRLLSTISGPEERSAPVGASDGKLFEAKRKYLITSGLVGAGAGGILGSQVGGGGFTKPTLGGGGEPNFS